MATREVGIKATRDSLSEIVKAEPKRYSEAELGRMLGVSRQRVHEIVKAPDLHQLVRPKQWSFHCVDCGKPIPYGVTRCRQCWLKIYGAKMVTLSCDFCGQQFERKESEARRHTLHFCSTSCRGNYAGRHYGFGAGKAKEVGLARLDKSVFKPAVAPAEFKIPPLEPPRGGLKLKTRIFEFYNKEYSNLPELARAMGLSTSQIYRVKHGKRAINEKFIIGALKAFPGYRLDELFYVAPDGSDDD